MRENRWHELVAKFSLGQILEQNCAVQPVFYEDEVDIDLNPKISADWQKKGKQKRIPSRGKMKNITLQEPCMQEQVEWTTSAEKVRILACLSICYVN